MPSSSAVALADVRSIDASRPRLVVVRAGYGHAGEQEKRGYAQLVAFAAATAVHAGLLFGLAAQSPAPVPLEVGSPVIELSFAPASEPAALVEPAAPAPAQPASQSLIQSKPLPKVEPRPAQPTPEPPTPQADPLPEPSPASTTADLAATAISAAPSDAHTSPDPTATNEPTPTTRFNGAPAKNSRSYYGQISAWIDANKDYPVAAKKDKEQGTVVVSFTIDRNGHLLSSAIKKSSGHRQLDDAALATLTRAAPFPPIPDFIDKDTLSIAVPIDYSLITN